MKITTALVFGIVASVVTCPTTALAGDRPNIILIMADDLGYECLTVNGGESYKTPHLDRLANAGMRFEQCHVQPLCTPTRVELMTGKYNVRNYQQFGVLPRSETTFAHVLKRAGYATAVCGKWQLGSEPDSPQHFGFDEAYLWQHTRRPPRYANPGLEHDARELDFRNGEYGPQLVNDFAVDFVTRHRERPFFLYYPMMLTHSPFQPTPDSPDWDPTAVGETVNDDVRHFAKMVAFMDALVGRLDARLGELGIRDNTILMFLGDNGTLSSVTSRFQAADYRGGKGETTARGTHVPLIVSWPAVIRSAAVCRDLVGTVDIFPTLCGIAGIARPDDLDGISFLPQLRGEPVEPRQWLYGWYSRRQRQGDTSVKEYAFDAGGKLYRSGEYFDLSADPFEEQPLDPATLSGMAADRAGKLRAVLERFRNARPPQLDARPRATPPGDGSKGAGLRAENEPPLRQLHPEDRAVVELILQHRGSRGTIGYQDIKGNRAIWVDDGGYKNTIGFVVSEKTGRIREIHGNGQWLNNQALRALAVCTELELISCLHNPRGMMKVVDDYSGEGLDALTALPIRHVSFSGAFDDRGMKAAARIPTLREVHARQTEVGDSGVAAFEGHPAIENLVIDAWSRPQFTVASLRSLAKMPRLKRFTFFGTYLTWENGFDQLVPMAGQIEEISLPNTLILPEDYEHVKRGFPRLTWPEIDYAKLLANPRQTQNWLKYADTRGVEFIQRSRAVVPGGGKKAK